MHHDHNINISMLVYDLVDSRSEVTYTGGGTASSVEKGGAWAEGWLSMLK